MASTYLTRTNASAATNVDKATISFWLKRSRVDTEESVFGAYSSDSNRLKFRFRSDNKFDFEVGVGGSWYSLITNRVFIDTSSWYHFVISYDSTQAAASDRTKIYINGVLETSYGTSNYVPQNQDFYFTKNSLEITIGDNYQGGSHQNFFDGLLSHFICVDGQALDATSFGETNSDTGEWKWKGISGLTYGNNGFYLLKDVANVTDYSGNNNNFTASGGTLTLTQDNPSNVFCTLNIIDNGWTGGRINLANGSNNTMNTSGAGDYGLRGTLAAKKGKYYMEFKTNNSGDGANTLGIAPTDLRLVQNITSGSPSAGVYAIQRYNDSSTNLYNNGSFISQNTAMFGGYLNNSDIISFAVDLDNSKIFVGKNGVFKDTSGNTGDPAAGTNPTFTIADSTKFYTFYTEFRLNQNNGTQCNFGNGYFGTTAVSSAGTNASGNGIFEYDVPAGFTALCTKGINSF